jgi:DNA (cytosine-5)-methyltransferase 1
MTAVKFNKRNKKCTYKVVSLFAGAGGLDMGFENKGFQVIWANDIDKDACETHRGWSNAEVVQGDISKIDFKEIPESEIIAGGFPCQGFSLAGPRKIDDKRNILYKYFVKLVDEKQPCAFIAENVKGLLTLGDGAIIEAIIEDFSDKGYYVFPNLVNAADYGVPQDRWRVIMVGFRKDLGIVEFKFPEPFQKLVTLRDALKNMPEPLTSDVCSGSYSSRYMSRNRKRGWDDVSYTIPAMAKQVTLHPSSPDMIKIGEDEWKFGESGKTRRLSWQEAAVIQTFPKNMQFVGNLTSKYKQIGNAVPVKLAEVVATELKMILDLQLDKNNRKREVGV